MIIEEEKYLKHYGILRKSGRYPWGSGDNAAQRSKTFFSELARLREEGLSDVDIARGWGMTTTELRSTTTLAKNQKKQAEIAEATALKDKGYSNVAIAEKMGLKNESSVRSLLAPGQKEKLDILETTSNMLRNQVEEKGVLDIGKGVEAQLGISKEKLNAAVSILKDEGYGVFPVQIDQVGTKSGQKTTTKVLSKPGIEYRDVVKDINQIKSISTFSEDGGRSYFGLKEPLSVDLKRVAVRYDEDGGSDFDGVIYVRPGVDDISLGGSNYAQVRIAVNGTHYLKGMAIYKDDLPPGVDLMFNTNKTSTGNKLDAMKPLKDDPDNPFGSQIKRQIISLDSKGKERVTSAMNIVNEEGDWEGWRRSISSQVLSKQSPKLAKEQLDLTYEKRRAQLDEIMSLTNPVVKKKLLLDYSESADSDALHLKAAALPRQRAQVLLPVDNLKDNEIYAPNFRNGERVALIRYPHGGTFEIPELTVNNRHPQARSLLGQAKDAVGINSKVASRLSGADFDGDTVLVIPNPASNPKLKTQPPLESLKGFDPQRLYKNPPGVEFKGNKQQLMGDVSNLITDMTIKLAPPNEIARAVRHSMVVIDAEKHNLDYKRSARENGIPALKEKYQGSKTAGASTLISRATSRTDVRKRKPRSMSKGGPIDKATGRKVYEEVGEPWTDAKGKIHYPMMRSKKLAETDDAFTLVSKGGGTPVERVYAEHSNRMKALANTARKEAVNSPPIKRSPSAAKVYAEEVKSLDAKLSLALRNAPRERQAQVLANSTIALKKQANPDMDHTELKRVSSQALEEARRRTGARKELVIPTEREWAAIQSGAISNNKLEQILNNSDMTRIKELATPRTQVGLSSTQARKAQSMANAGYTQAEIADALGVGLTTLKEGLK